MARHPELAHDPGVLSGFQARNPPTRRALLAHRLAVKAAGLAIRTKRPAAREGPPEVTILLMSAYDQGGIVRSVMNLAGALAQERRVRVVSLLRTRTRPFTPTPPGVKVMVLVDRRKDLPAGLRGWIRSFLGRRKGRLVHPDDNYVVQTDLWTDLALVRYLRGARPALLIATRHSFGFIAAEFAGQDSAVVLQEHMNLASRSRSMQRDIRRAVPKLDAVAVLTEADRRAYEAFTPRGLIVAIPNGVPPPSGPPSELTSPVVIAAGRLTWQKGFDLLIRAFARVAEVEPDWMLKICGKGRLRDTLAGLVAECGVAEQVQLGRHVRDMESEMERASIFVLSSRFEGFPMVLVEAMSKGLPVVAFDCQTGPAELVDHGVNGFLVPFGDLDGLAASVLELIRDEGKRQRFGAAARERAREYTSDRVVESWRALLSELG
jgi:glycosyltransferase involved in cell wall biosynthesis